MTAIEFVDHESLASYLLRGDLTAPQTAKIIDLTNRTVTEVVGDTLDPVPVRVEAIAYEVAARAVRTSLPTSETKSSDGTSKTTRHEPVAARDLGVYLSENERLELLQAVGRAATFRRRRPRTIRTFVP